MILVYALGFHRYLAFDHLKTTRMQVLAWIDIHPILAPLTYIAIYAVATALSLPGGIFLSIFGGFFFGLPWAILYVVIGATLGATTIFLSASTAIGDYLQKKAGKNLLKLRAGFQKHAWSYMLFLRLIPLFPFWLVNIAPAFFGIKLSTYLWTTALGILPGVYIYTQAGEGLGEIFDRDQAFTFASIFSWKLRIAFILIACLLLLPVVIKRWRDRH